MTGPGDERLLILGGTAEARHLAAVLVAARRPVTSSLAGRVSDPALPAGEVRIGGFSATGVDGVAGLTRYLDEHRITTVVDATHPFAATISAHAVTATARAGVRLLRLVRPGWRDHPDADRWTWVESMAAAGSAGTASRRPFLTTGRQSLAVFLESAGWAEKSATVRVVDPPQLELPPRWRLIRSRGPYAYDGERALMAEAETDLLVTKDSGGRHTEAKLAAARDLGVPVVVVSRPPTPSGVPCYTTVTKVLDALA